MTFSLLLLCKYILTVLFGISIHTKWCRSFWSIIGFYSLGLPLKVQTSVVYCSEGQGDAWALNWIRSQDSSGQKLEGLDLTLALPLGVLIHKMGLLAQGWNCTSLIVFIYLPCFIFLYSSIYWFPLYIGQQFLRV